MNYEGKWVLIWFEKGDHDLQTIEGIYHLENPPLDMVCFHAQQCVEKYLKGFLTFHRRE
jgi:HEPN domain-containing protein